MGKYIEGTMKGTKFTSTEPLAIGIECVNRMPGSGTSGLAADVVSWAWNALVSKNKIVDVFNREDIYMEVKEK